MVLLVALVTVGCRRTRKAYYPNGNLRSEISLKGGHYHGPARFYYEEGTLQMECSYAGDSLEWAMIRYYETGARKEEMYFRKNRRDSIYRLWNPQQVLLAECFYRDSLLEGECRIYYDNGTMKSTGRYSRGEATGQWLFFDENGHLIGKENWGEKGSDP